MSTHPRAVLLTGGRQKKNAYSNPEWDRFRKGIVLRLDLETGEATEEVEYPAPVSEDSGAPTAVLFKAGTLQGGVLYTCTSTEVLLWSVPGFDLLNRISLPEFNDLHHVVPTAEGTLLIVNTGLDMVLEMEASGTVRQRWNVLGEGDPWGRFSSSEDYRLVPSTKPHASHPNFVFEVGGGLEGERQIWVTRFEQRDALCLTHPERRMEIGPEGPHDGILKGDRVYFTTVDGKVVVTNLKTGNGLAVHDLRAMAGTDRALGWCRGLAMLDDDYALVGFSRFRPTRLLANVRWVAEQVGLVKNPRSLPTRLSLFDLKGGRLVREWNLEDFDLNVLFSVLPLP